MVVPSLDDVLAELRDLQQRLSELPEDAFAERLKVRERRRELHVRAVELREFSRSSEDLQKELDDLRRLRDQVFVRHLSIGNIGPGGGEGGGGIEVRYVVEVNRTIDEAWDLDHPAPDSRAGGQTRRPLSVVIRKPTPGNEPGPGHLTNPCRA